MQAESANRAHLVDRCAIVTGAASGIGACAARRLAAGGVTVAVTDMDADGAQNVSVEIIEHGGLARPYCLDVTSESDWASCVGDLVARGSAPTILVSNAALTAPAAIDGDLGVLDFDMALWDRVMDVNLRGAVLGLRAVLPTMIRNRGGSVVMTSSVSSVIPVGTARTAYAASKAATNSLVRSVAARYGRDGIRCNAVAPGFISTEQMSAMLASERSVALTQATSLGRLGRPEDIADVIFYLASGESSYITGQVVVADGGVSTHINA
jgi:NAD(P)-dependent dehydrogenase (short-subunit alcohol dehydrogenase family)